MRSLLDHAHFIFVFLGWEGAGLGSKEQGIQAPIKGGEVRNKAEQFAGVGMAQNNDPFEQFRRSKSYTYNRRPPSGEREGESKCIIITQITCALIINIF